jgi:hypothetical protein
MKRSVGAKRLGYEASAGWTTYGTSLAAFSLFQGVATQREGSSEKVAQPAEVALLRHRTS